MFTEHYPRIMQITRIHCSAPTRIHRSAPSNFRAPILRLYPAALAIHGDCLALVTRLTAWALFVGAALMAPTTAYAQGLETLGSRAAALGAFVAVADDASAVVWNPAGLVTGPIMNISLDFGRSETQPPDPPVDAKQARRTATTLIAFGSTPVGLAYYRIAVTTVGVVSPAGVGSPDRQDGQVFLRTVVTSHLGATVQQSFGNHVTVGATVKLVRGHVGEETRRVPSWQAAFDVAERNDARDVSQGDVDIGAMLSAGRLRAGVVVRNATSPTFGDEQGVSVTLPRHARVGVAWADRWPGIAQTVVAFDADLTDVPHPEGERRDVAVGVERWSRARQFGVRAGVRGSTTGEARPIASVGASYAVRQGTYVDAYIARGRADDRAWGVATRLTY